MPCNDATKLGSKVMWGKKRDYHQKVLMVTLHDHVAMNQHNHSKFDIMLGSVEWSLTLKATRSVDITDSVACHTTLLGLCTVKIV